jgi:hypothetical protein
LQPEAVITTLLEYFAQQQLARLQLAVTAQVPVDFKTKTGSNR